jgi:hypothetical protein
LVFGFVTLIYFVAFSILAVYQPIPCAARFPVIAILGICAAFATGFLGNYAAVQGQLPLPLVRNAPIAISAGGGLAVLIIVLIIGWYMYIAGCSDNPIVPAVITNVSVVPGNETTNVFLVAFRPPKLPSGVIAVVELAYSDDFATIATTRDIDQPSKGAADVPMSPQKWPVWIRIGAFDTATNRPIISGSSQPWRQDKPSE